MNVLSTLLRCGFGFLIMISATQNTHAAAVVSEHLNVELIAADTALIPGQTAWLGLRLQHEDQWHTYWRNPGDSGLETRLTWNLPEGLIAGAIAWPAPHRLQIGELYNFGFDGEMVLPVQVTVPANAKLGESIDLQVKADWLVCKEECIPGSANLVLRLPIASASSKNPAWEKLFADAFATQAKLDHGWQTKASINGNTISIQIRADSLPIDGYLDAFAASSQLLSNAPPQIQRSSNLIEIKTELSDYFAKAPRNFDLLITAKVQDQLQSWQVNVVWPTNKESPLSERLAPLASVALPLTTTDDFSIGLAILLAFLGGVLLNLMPCVFPVLSLKAISIAESSAEPARARHDGLAYLMGSIAGFLILAIVLILLRATGSKLGWGFQLQSPTMIASLVYIMVALGLSLSGVFVLGSRLSGMGQSLTEGHGKRAAFFTGLLACVVASPCTAPFMGPALGFALTQPFAMALLVFIALGVGLAFPIVLLGFVPALSRILPKPGAWMNTLKQILAWPLYLTAVWLLWVLMRQVDANQVALILVGIVLLCASLVWLGQKQFQSSSSIKNFAWIILLSTSLVPMYLLANSSTSIVAPTWQEFSAAKLVELRQQKKPVLVNMTAAWCITCLANERVALSSDRFKKQIRELDIEYLKGDWTRQDPAITTYLAQFGRSGVPLYVIYPKGDGPAEVLPQLLTPNLVESALSRAAAGSNSATDSRSTP